MKNIFIYGAGYVGYSLAVALSKNNNVILIEKDETKVKLINEGFVPIKDEYIERYLKNNGIKLKAILLDNGDLTNADYVFLCIPTNYDKEINRFNTNEIEKIVKNLSLLNAKIIIKSTLPIGFCNYLEEKLNIRNLYYMPEFLREDSALKDLLNPNRIVLGYSPKSGNNQAIEEIFELFYKISDKKDIQTVITHYSEAEAIKLFSNAYLAMRVAFFNELDTFAMQKNLNTTKIIEGVCLDSRIGNFYNNPSFGYGGYCLPKDTLQLSNIMNKSESILINSITKSNEARKNYIANQILNKKINCLGVYKLEMKKWSSNFRNSSILDIINIIKYKVKKVIVYEPNIKSVDTNGILLYNDIVKFKKESDLILSNRFYKDLEDIKYKLLCRDIFCRD